MNALIPVVNGSEEMEVVIVADVLRRAAWRVVIAGLNPGAITAAHGVRLLPDAEWNAIKPDTFDWLIIPGGAEGVAAMARDERVLSVVRQFASAQKQLAAICAGPLVLQAAGVLTGRRVTCHPGVSAELTQGARNNERVVIDGHLITSQAPGTTFEFALAIVRAVQGKEKAAALAQAMVLD